MNLLEFKPIPGYEGLYSVNQNNQVLSHERKVYNGSNRPGLRTIKEKILINGKDKQNHLSVSLCKQGFKNWKIGIHVLVAITWDLPKEPHHNVVKHLNNNPLHNYASNLQWDTLKQNTIDAANAGLIPNGENHCNTKLTNQDVLYIRSSSLSGSELGKIYNTTKSTINKIKRRVTWKHI